MSSDFYQVVWLSLDEALLYGEREDGSQVRIDLTVEQAKRVEALEAKHQHEMTKLLRELAA